MNTGDISMRTFTITSDFGTTSEYQLGSDNVIRNSIGRAAMDDQVAEIAKHHDISVEIIKATQEARDGDIRAFLGLNMEENIGKAINRHIKKQIKAQF